MNHKKINFYNQTKYEIKSYKKIIQKALKKQKSKQSIEIVFVDNEEIQRLNKFYRNIDKVTDVLSFPNDEIETKSLGDVFINVDQAIVQSNEYGHNLLREFAFLAVHGYLHLLGYDHETKEQENAMFKLQKEILDKAKIERDV